MNPDAPVTVKIMKRNLDVMGTALKKKSSRAVHYHAVAFDGNGKIVGDFGWSGEGNPVKNTLVGSTGRVFSEPASRFELDYDQTPVAEARVSFKDWTLVQSQFRYNEADSGYRTFNNGWNDYRSPMEKGGREYFNCQFAMSRFWEELQKTETFSETMPFAWPASGTINADALDFRTGVVASENALLDPGQGVANSGCMQPMRGNEMGTRQSGPVPASGANIPVGQAIPAELAAMLGQVPGQIANAQSQGHACTSFEFVKAYRGANREVYAKRYRCRECGRETMVNVRDGETIEEKAASNKQRRSFADQAYSAAQSALQGVGTSAQNCGYSPELMDQFGRTFAEQGPCSAGLQLEALKNQPPNK